MSKNPYADVIDIIINLNVDEWKPLVIEIAKVRPTVVLSACERLGIKYPIKPAHEHSEKVWFEPVCRAIMENRNSEMSGKIHGIRELRNMTGLSLMKSKPIVEDIMEKCGDYIDSLQLQTNNS